MTYYVYTISISNSVVYVGLTGVGLDIREKQHRSAYTSMLKRLKNNNNTPSRPVKKLYVWMSQNNVKPAHITLIPIDICKTKVEAKRKEFFYMILYTYFKGVKLCQKLPGLRNY